jgi:hypothetical protein
MNLLELQRRMGADVMRPLTEDENISPRTRAAYIKPNDRNTAVERLEIYNRQYWFRILDSLYEDFPGLLAVLGQRSFHRLAIAYLTDCPSRSFTLRNLGSRLVPWLGKHPEYAGRSPGLALDMVRLEWAHIEAFDEAAVKPIEPEDLVEVGPGLSLALQPHIRLLHLGYPVDELRLQISTAENEHATASNAVSEPNTPVVLSAVKRPKKREVFVAVYRFDDAVYYRRLDPREFRILKTFERGATIAKAVGGVDPGPHLERWFAAWAELGWLCHSELMP